MIQNNTFRADGAMEEKGERGRGGREERGERGGERGRERAP